MGKLEDKKEVKWNFYLLDGITKEMKLGFLELTINSAAEWGLKAKQTAACYEIMSWCKMFTR